MDLVLRNARCRGHKELLDVAIEAGRIEAVGPHLAASAPREIDLQGRLLSPGFVNLHLHADKALLGEIMRPNVSGRLPEAIAITNEFKRAYEPREVAQRAGRVVETGILNGTTFFRLFADVGTLGGLRAAEGLLETRQRYRGLADIQVVAFPQEGLERDPGAEQLLLEAMELGCDVVGGLPWYEYTDEDARDHIDACFRLAQRFDRDIHMLVDDTDDPNSRSLEYLALKTKRERFHGRVSASHCGALAAYNDVYAAKVIDMVAEAGITISCNAHINLVCSGRLDHEPRRRGITRVKELLAAGVNLVSAQDDVNDPYYPFGKPDQLEVALFVAHTAQLTLPHELQTVFDMVTSNAARAARLSGYGLAPGCQADLVVIDAPSVHEALRLQPPRLHVFKAGREIARATASAELLVAPG